MMRRTVRIGAGATAAAVVVAVLGGCGGDGASPAATVSGRTLNVIMVDNPQMKDLVKLVEDGFSAKSGITVNVTLTSETDVRDKVTLDVATQAGTYDVVSIGAYEAPIWADKGWLHELSGYVSADSAYDPGDLLKPMVSSLFGKDGKLYAAPFYGESSMLMYRKDVFAAEGLTMPRHPTWTQVASLAAQVDGARSGMDGICLRGLPGWGEVFAPLSTVINTFGGTFFEKNWTAKVNAPAFVRATDFYVDLVRAHGQPEPTTAGFGQCLEAMSTGKVAMWYDATSAAGLLEDAKTSKAAGKIGYAYAPVERTASSGWLWAWALAIPQGSRRADDAALFLKWATSKEYEELVGTALGWSRVPSGKRASTYARPEYQEATAAFGAITLRSIQTADPVSPGVQARPAVGVQFVGIPEFADLATRISHDLAGAFNGTTTVKDVLNRGQALASDVALIHTS